MHRKLIKNLIEKYREFPIPLKATIWFTVCQFLQKSLSVLTTPFFTRLLPAEEYGKISVFFSWESIVVTLITLSSGKSIFNLCVHHDDKDKLLSSIIGLNVALAIAYFLVTIIFLKQIVSFTGLSELLLICMNVHCFFKYNVSCWIGIKNYQYSYKAVVVETLFCSFFSLFGGLAAVIFISKTAEAKILPDIICTTMVGIIIMISIFIKGKVFYNREIWKYALSFSIPLIPHYLSEIVLMSSDRIMIDRMSGSTDVAIYSIGYSVGSLILMIINAINSAFTPYQYQKIKLKEYKILAQNTNYIIGFIAFCLCGVMLFGREIVLIFGGQKYIESISLIIPISLGVFFNYVFQLFARVQEYFEQKYTIVIASISCAVLNVLLNYIFIGIYGYKAAAYTTFVCYFLFCFLHFLFYKKACKKYVGQEIYDIKGLALISAVLIAAAFVISIINKLYFLKYIILAAALMLIIWKRKQILEFIKIIKEK